MRNAFSGRLSTTSHLVLSTGMSLWMAMPKMAIAATVKALPLATAPLASKSIFPADILLYVAVCLLTIVTGFSILVSLYVYRWRAILLRDGRLHAPEAMVTWLQQVTASLNTLAAAHNSLGPVLNGMAVSVTAETQDTKGQVAGLMQAFLTLQKALDEKDQEIKRLREGYDTRIFQKFVARFLRVKQAIEDIKQSGGITGEGILQLDRLLVDALDECGVEQFEPVVGSDYRNAEGIAEPPQTIPAPTEADHYKIAEVVEAGYRLVGGDKAEILVPATVRIFVR